jgi:hypothetical protein
LVKFKGNVIADQKAKEELTKGITPLEHNNRKGQPWKAKCKGHIITGNAEERLRYTMQAEELKEWWTKKLINPDQSQHPIQWDV